MKQHLYRITVEHLADKDGNLFAPPISLQFEARNHDDVLAIVERVKSRNDIDSDRAAAFAVGLKLFGETILENKDRSPFKEFFPNFVEFMQQFKNSMRSSEWLAEHGLSATT